jgi:hypothetical protein
LETKPTTIKRLRLPAAVLSGSLLIANTAMSAEALAQPLPVPEPGITAPIDAPEDISALKQALAKHRAAIEAARLLDNHPQVVTDANYAFTPTWWRCSITPESGGKAHEPGTGGLFGFLSVTWHSEPYAHIWQSQQPPGADWSEPWKAPVYIQAQAALVLWKENEGFGPEAWHNSANCGKDG